VQLVEGKSVTLPAVFRTSIRLDIVQQVHTNMAKNKRQAYSVSEAAGHQTSAVSWGTGRAVARIPRVSGGGTHRAGQGAFGNMCRGGRMFAPTKTFRRFHRKISKNQRRFAVASALAASALPSLVMARGHSIYNVPEVPLVVSNSVETLTKTKDALAFLAKVKADDDVNRVKATRKMRAGQGKLRDRRFVSRRGPLVVYETDGGLVKALRNIPGVEACSVDRLNLLQLAPGGHLGRFVVWTEGAFKKLEHNFGTFKRESAQKKGYSLPKPMMAQTDLGRLINSDEVQSVLRAAGPKAQRPAQRKKNPLTNLQTMLRLNPYAKQTRRAEVVASSKAKVTKKVPAAKAARIRSNKKTFKKNLITPV